MTGPLSSASLAVTARRCALVSTAFLTALTLAPHSAQAQVTTLDERAQEPLLLRRHVGRA